MAEATETQKRVFSASARMIRMTARKARSVMDVVRGRPVDEALTYLRFIYRRAAPYIGKVIQSAVANAEDHANRKGFNIDAAKLIVSEARVDEGPMLKRFRARSRGQAGMVQKKTCHLIVSVSEAPEEPKEPAKGEKKEAVKKPRPEWKKPRVRVEKADRLAKREAKKAGKPYEIKTVTQAKWEEKKAKA
ncbi:MAG: 50S ribosomal protein L22 [Planctomycetes bacterium]|nr:50S ribosomal protein L22 [Planctomycetota bacterium]